MAELIMEDMLNMFEGVYCSSYIYTQYAFP
jgi:hypothetical protein